MIFAHDGDGGLIPITREELATVWQWQRGKLRHQLVLAVDAPAVIESMQREGWHAWQTPPVMVTAY